MKTIILSLSLVLVGCSHVETAPKTVQFPYAAELLQKIQKTGTRAPASKPLEAKEEKSARRVYFSSLYHQYLALGSYLQHDTQINSCPQFHHDKVETDAAAVPKLSLYRPKHIQEEGKSYFPELAFEGKSGLKEYLADVRSELMVLCEEGVSDNLYKFDNLVTHYAGNKEFHKKPKAMESVLKIPVFANFYLVKMMSTGNSEVTEETRFIEMTQTYWFRDYVAEARQQRGAFIKNKVVVR